MNRLTAFILLLYGLAGLFIVFALLYLVYKRIKDKDQETFEKRNS